MKCIKLEECIGKTVKNISLNTGGYYDEMLVLFTDDTLIYLQSSHNERDESSSIEVQETIPLVSAKSFGLVTDEFFEERKKLYLELKEEFKYLGL